VPSGTQYRLVICPLNNCEFEMRLFEPKSPLPGNGISRAETKAPRRTRRFKDAICVTHPLRQSPDRHATAAALMPASHFMKGLKRLRKAAFWPTAHMSSQSLESYWPGSSSSSCTAPSLPICHQIRTGDQPRPRAAAARLDEKVVGPVEPRTVLFWRTSTECRK
jgi:hypothetical protein